MALSERSRSEFYQALSSLVSQEAIGEMLSYFPARDVEEPVTKEFLRAESAVLRSDVERGFSEIRGEMDRRFAEVQGEMNRRFTEFQGDMDRRFAEVHGEMDRGFAEVRSEVAELRGEMRGLRTMAWVNVMLLVSFAGLLTATNAF